MAVCLQYLRYYEERERSCASVPDPEGQSRVRGIRDERPEDTAAQEAWDVSQCVEQGLHWLGTRGFTLIEQLLLPASGQWRQWDAWPVRLRPPREAYAALLQALDAVVSPAQRHKWGTTPLGGLPMQGPQMLPLELWFPSDADSRWAWHDQRRVGQPATIGAGSSPTARLSDGCGRSRRP
eukprot:3460825-Rhodomonas_salina.1